MRGAGPSFTSWNFRTVRLDRAAHHRKRGGFCHGWEGSEKGRKGLGFRVIMVLDLLYKHGIGYLK